MGQRGCSRAYVEGIAPPLRQRGRGCHTGWSRPEMIDQQRDTTEEVTVGERRVKRTRSKRRSQRPSRPTARKRCVGVGSNLIHSRGPDLITESSEDLETEGGGGGETQPQHSSPSARRPCFVPFVQCTSLPPFPTVTARTQWSRL